MNSEIKNKHDDETLRIAQDVSRELPTRNLKEKTKQLYVKTAKIYYDELHKILETTSKRTYYVRRAALIYLAEEELKEAVRTKKAGQAAKAMLVLAKFLSTPVAQNSQARSAACPLVAPTNRVSKRRSLSGLPVDWREQLIDAAIDPKMGEVLLLLAATGIRPSEVEKGVTIEPIEGGVRVIVRGTKTDREHGQKLRVFDVFSKLAERLGGLGAQLIKVDHANRISSQAGRLGRKIFGQTRVCTVSAYSFRHQFASELKASQASSADVSAILGHSASDTKQSYGCFKQGRAGEIRVKLVHASQQVKLISKHPRPAKRFGSTKISTYA